MPSRTKKWCPTCRVVYIGERCRQCSTSYNKRRGNSTARGYNYRWEKARRAYLKANPLCVKCLEQGRTTAAKVVDHIVPHKGDDGLFWDVDNWQALCTSCHSSDKQREERA
jgi:5-methylcytosine-specific restriction protein A